MTSISPTLAKDGEVLFLIKRRSKVTINGMKGLLRGDVRIVSGILSKKFRTTGE